MQVEILECYRPHRELVYNEPRVRHNTYPADSYSLTQHRVSYSCNYTTIMFSLVKFVLSGQIANSHTTK